MIPNVNQFTQQLRMLPDAILRRLAQMYKQDPYIFPMVISEDMARKKLRASAQAQAAQSQPKVNDQALMAMGEEAQQPVMAAGGGLLTLKAPNMERMADGGIAGYDDMATYAEGGNVVMAPGSTPSYQRTAMSPGMLDFAQHSEPVIRMAEGGVARYADQGLVRARAGEYALQALPQIEAILALDPYVDESGNRRSARETASILERQERAQAQKSSAEAFMRKEPTSQVRTSPGQTALEAVTAKPAAPVAGPPLKEPPLISETGQRYTLTEPAPAAASAAKPAPAPAPAPTPPRATGTGAGAPAAPADGGIYSLAGRLFDPIEERTRAQLGRMRMTAQQRSEEEQAAFEAGKPKGKAYEGLEGLLKKEEEGEAGEREQAKAMAIFNAGLAMMAGGSPRALENIAKGAMVGTGQYAEAMKDFKRAAKERQKMLANIEEARRAEARDDNKTALAAMQRANDNESRMEMFALEAGTSLGLKKADLTGRLYGTQMEIGARERIARMPSADMQLVERIAQEKNIPFSQAFEYVRGAMQAPRTRESLMKEWSESLILQQRYKTAKDYADAQMNVGGGLSSTGINLGQWGEPQVVGGR